MKPIMVVLLILLAGLQYKLWVGDDSIINWMQTEKKLKTIEARNQKDKLRNQVLEAEIVELQSGDQALEEQARQELGMVKDSEEYYHCPD